MKNQCKHFPSLFRQWKRLYLGVIALSAAPAGIADELYRANMPPVLKVAQEDSINDTALVGAYLESYRKAGVPRIALYWNQALAGAVEDYQIARARISDYDTKLDIFPTRAKGRDRTREDIDEAARWALESAFTKTFQKSGTFFVDRTTIMRLLHAESSVEKPTVLQTVEVAALRGHADMYLEVLMTRDSRSPHGLGFKVSLRDINNGKQLLSFYSTAIRTNETVPEFEATERGFQRKISLPPALEDIGQRLALETMRQFTTSTAFP